MCVGLVNYLLVGFYKCFTTEKLQYRLSKLPESPIPLSWKKTCVHNLLLRPVCLNTS